MIKNKILICIFVILFATSANSEENFPYYGKLDPKPKIVIEVFSSLTCPHCADFHFNYLPGLIEKYVKNGSALIILKDFPLDQAALIGAQISKCLTNEGQKKYLDEVYKTQSKWMQSKTLSDLNNYFFNIIKDLGLNNEKDVVGLDCLKNKPIKRFENIVLQSRIDAMNKYEINSTPSFLINKKKFKGSIKDLEKYIDKLL